MLEVVRRRASSKPRPLRALAAMAAVGALLMVTSGCSQVGAYRARVAAEDAFGRGAKAAERNDLATADHGFAQALRIQPHSASLHARIGMAYVRMKPPQPARALPRLQRSLRLNPAQPFPVYLDAALAAARLGREAYARRVLQQAAKRFRNDAMALNDIGYMLADADKLTREALPLLQRAVELAPRSGIIIDSLGWAYYRLGDLRQAAELLERASDLAPGNPEIEFHLGVVYAALGRTAEARAQLRRALQRAPEFAPARAALNHLEREE